MSIHEIVLAGTKPETEWVRGRALKKVSPTYSHARLQMLVAFALAEWADSAGLGRVGTEWRFRVAPPGAIVRPLVPDVAYLSYEDLPRDAAPIDVEIPLGSPTVAVEILSPDDRPRDVEDKIAVYRSAGCKAVLVIDPAVIAIVLHDAGGVRTTDERGIFRHDALPGFSLDVAALFERARR
jgi:Uma2 family endonuclease